MWRFKSTTKNKDIQTIYKLDLGKFFYWLLAGEAGSKDIVAGRTVGASLGLTDQLIS